MLIKSQYLIDLAFEIHISSTGPLAYSDYKKIIQNGNGQ